MRKVFFLIAVVLISTVCASAQKNDKEITGEYLRSSLYTIILDDHGLMDSIKAKIIKETFFSTPLPEKFNDHNLADKFRTFNPATYTVTPEDEAKFNSEDAKPQKKKGGFGSMMGSIGKSVASSATAGLVDTTDTKQLPVKFVKFFEENAIANQIVAKWYNVDSKYDDASSSFFNMELIKQRGLYNATEFDKSIADKSARGIQLLADAGENLIKGTFVVGIRFNYVSKEEIAKQLQATTSAISGLLGGKVAAIADAAAQVGGAVAGKGYVIKATAFLYQLEWDEEVSNLFYTDYYNATDLSDFYNSKAFKFTYVGSESEWADIQSTIFSKKTEEELVQRAAIRSIDEVIAKLQKKFEVFRTKTPLLTVEPELTAQIGLKEGLKAGDKYEVLEKTEDPETGIAQYKRVDVIKVEKNMIWDNRYAADEEAAEKAKESGKEEAPKAKATTFKGGKKNKMYPGMLIRQID